MSTAPVVLRSRCECRAVAYDVDGDAFEYAMNRLGRRPHGADLRPSSVVPIPKAVARFNKHVTNPVTRRFAGRLPGFAIVTHVGRSSGRTYRTPVNVFRDGERYVFALTYGADSDWVRNVLAAGGCTIETRGQTVELTEPERFDDPSRRAIPPPARWVLEAIGVDQFLAMRPAAR